MDEIYWRTDNIRIFMKPEGEKVMNIWEHTQIIKLFIYTNKSGNRLTMKTRLPLGLPMLDVLDTSNLDVVRFENSVFPDYENGIVIMRITHLFPTRQWMEEINTMGQTKEKNVVVYTQCLFGKIEMVDKIYGRFER